MDGLNSDNAILPVVVCQEESNTIMSTGPQARTAAVANVQNLEMASQDVLPTSTHSMPQNDDAPLNNHQDSIMLDLEESQCDNTLGTSKSMHSHILKVMKDVPAPKLCSHTEWEETDVVSPVEELQKRLVKHASIISPEVVEDTASGKISIRAER